MENKVYKGMSKDMLFFIFTKYVAALATKIKGGSLMYTIVFPDNTVYGVACSEEQANEMQRKAAEEYKDK